MLRAAAAGRSAAWRAGVRARDAAAARAPRATVARLTVALRIDARSGELADRRIDDGIRYAEIRSVMADSIESYLRLLLTRI